MAVNMDKAFRITMGKGVHMKFSNGWGISVQWGPGNYCDNYGIMAVKAEEYAEAGSTGSDTAEIAIIKPDGGFFEHPGYTSGESVEGRLTADGVAEYIAWTVAQP